jgi:hypothetical protein
MDNDENFFDTVDFGYTQTQPDSSIGEQPTPSTQHHALTITEKGGYIDQKYSRWKYSCWKYSRLKI